MSAAKLVGMMVRGDAPLEELITAGAEAFEGQFHKPANVAYICDKHEIMPDISGIAIRHARWIPYKSWCCVGRNEANDET
jgi:hypothetical protein